MINEFKSLVKELTSGDDHRAENAVARLIVHGINALPYLEEMIVSSESDTRWWAVRCLAQLENPPIDLLVESLADPSLEVRQCAALAICHHPDKSAIQKLLEMIAEPDPIAANLAASALIAIGEESIPGFLEVLPELKEVGRIEAIRAMACIGDYRALPILMSALGEDSLTINYWAEEGLTRLGLDMVYIKPD